MRSTMGFPLEYVYSCAQGPVHQFVPISYAPIKTQDILSVNGVIIALETLLGVTGEVVGLYNYKAKNSRYV